ncbi:hypothetical protein [Streptomyces sp. NPDC002889]
MGDPLTGHIADIDSLVLNADGSLLATTDEDDITRLWSIPNP